MIGELYRCTEAELAEIDALMRELNPDSSCSRERIGAVLSDANAHLYVARLDGRIVGCATLCVAHTPEFVLGFVEAVVVSESCRGKKMGRALMEHLIGEARSAGVDSLHLTSNPARIAANALYRTLGFSLYETNDYRMRL
ncbi:MAG: GNAT family N-acetyltransferase [Candidatus Cryptobacteroides sp.]